jgi:hypothetical protein
MGLLHEQIQIHLPLYSLTPRQLFGYKLQILHYIYKNDMSFTTSPSVQWFKYLLGYPWIERSTFGSLLGEELRNLE